ncbi:DUF3108 domain-containing protein [Massilia horti]|uniref:DUF3108 domain-containing protein n=1 Tax=Massilia horti TaxID=2562153 RepID=A0A4Y9SVL0_9BURK|nr:DUF3108 domain-containing protein [Massilia horti]TFW30822.1 DUF3108 domain-containing protein [Massilia horti]
MRRDFLTQAGAALLLAATMGGTVAAEEHPVVKHPFNLAPSADLVYDLNAHQRGFALNGQALIGWRTSDGRYSVSAESRVALLGKLTENRSQGTIDSFGLAPSEFYEKRFRKDPTTSTFNRESKTLTFSEGKDSYPLKGGEQDRASVTWQLVALARAAGDKFKPGSTWPFFVAGRRDADPWTFRVVRYEKVRTGLGELDTVHVTREPSDANRGQTLDIWLAPSLEWYPVKLRFTDEDKDFVEQTLSKLTRK